MGKKTREIENKKYKFYLREEDKLGLRNKYKFCKISVYNHDYIYKCPKCGKNIDDSSQEGIWCNDCKCMFNVCMECSNIKCDKCSNYMEIYTEDKIFCRNCCILQNFDINECNLLYNHLLEWAIEYEDTVNVPSTSKGGGKYGGIKPKKIKYYLELNDFKNHNLENSCHYGLNWYCPRCHNDEILFPD
jgi:hypothetical protein